MTVNDAYELTSRDLTMLLWNIRTDTKSYGWVNSALYDVKEFIRENYEHGYIDKIQKRRLTARWYNVRKALRRECAKFNVSLT